MSKDSTEKLFLEDYSPKDKKWDYHKLSSDKIEYFYATSESNLHKRYAERMEMCADVLRFNFVDNGEESKLKLVDTKFCRVRLCPVCQWRRSLAWRMRLFQRLPVLIDDHPNLNFIFLTLTVKNINVRELSETLKQMNDAFSRLRKLIGFTRVVKGFIRATEVTRSDIGEAHPHFHCILAVEKSYFKSKYYLSKDDWANMWMSSLRVNYVPIVDVRKIKQKGNKIESNAVLETLKYTIKIEDLVADKDFFLTLTDQLFRKRFIATGGCFKDVLKEETSEKEMLCKDDEDKKKEELNKSLYFGWKPENKKYRKVKNPFE